jgi:hypothetical protein
VHIKRMVISMFAGIALVVFPFVGLAGPAIADSACSVDANACTLGQGVATPAGLVVVTVSAGNVVTVQLTPVNPRTWVFGLPFSYPPGPPIVPGLQRITVITSGGAVNIDTVVIPPGPPARLSLPNLAVISLHPPSPCRVAVNGFTVVFTPTIPPGPPA